MRFFTLIPLATFAVLVSALPSSSSNHVLHEKRVAHTRGWLKSRRLEADKVLPMRFGLTQRNLDKLEDMLMSVSHPESPKYGQHFSAAEIVETFAPSFETISAVTNWLTGSGLAKERLRLSTDKGWIEVNATTAEVEELLKTEYHVYTHSSGAEQISKCVLMTSIEQLIQAPFTGCHEYSVPADVRDHVDLIKPTVHFTQNPSPRNPVKRRSFEPIGVPGTGLQFGPKTNGKLVKITPVLEDCDEIITPDCLRALYSIDHTPVASHKNTFGIGDYSPFTRMLFRLVNSP